MNEIWTSYKNLLGVDVVDQLFEIAQLLKGARIVHVNSTKEGGGVAEILSRMVPLMNDLGLAAHWETISGDEDFFRCTKSFHNLLQGTGSTLPDKQQLNHYETINRKNSERLAPILKEADFVMIHDPQPLSMMPYFKERKGKWIWRCHIETSTANQSIWQYLRPFIDLFDAAVFSLETFHQKLPIPTYIIAPSIDPFSEKNIELGPEKIQAVYSQFNIDLAKPVLLQVSRFDRFKDPLGVIQAFRLARKYHKDLQLVLVGGGAVDDPEGPAIFKEVMENSKNDKNIFILNLPANSYHIVNALQRGATIILQKSIKEGFGLTVTEALWKEKPVIGGNTGGIRIQVLDHCTGLLVNSPEGAASRIRYLLENPEKGKELGLAGKLLVKENFLITRHLRELLSMMATLLHQGKERIELASLKPSTF